MDMMEELQEKEAKLAEELAGIEPRYRRIVTELEMVRHGIRIAKVGKKGMRPARQRWTTEIVAEAESLYESGQSWRDVANQLGVDEVALSSAVKRKRRGTN